jgi:predicted Zn finger-like uncharacterized protein
VKFICDQCKTKYSIADERVRGKVLKIRCKQCNHVITVREETARTTGPNAVLPAPSKALEKALDQSFSGSQDFEGGERTLISSNVDVDALIAASGKAKAPAAAGDWFVSFDGEQEGPFSLEKVVARVKAEKGREAHAWREGFDGWLPVAKVPEIAAALKPPAPAHKDPTPIPPPRPRANTPRPPIPAEAMRPGTPAAGVQRREPTGRQPVLRPATATPAPAAAMAKSPSRPVEQPTMLERPAPSIPQPTLLDRQAPSMPMSAGRSSPATALAAAAAPQRVPTIDTTPAPLPAPPVLEPTPTPAPIAIPAPSAPLPVAATGPIGMPTPLPTPTPTPAPAAVPELLISEPSMVAALPSAPAVGANGHSAAPAPVVIITGPARGSSSALKYALIGGAVVIVGLLGAVGYLLFGRHPPVVAALPPAPIVASKGTPVDDKPATAVDPAPNVAPPPSTPAAKVDSPKTPSVKKTPTSTKPPPTKNLSGNQTALASLYNDSDKAPARELPSVPKPEAKQSQVSETQLADVVRKNKQSLTLCYERVLKRDNQLKNARIDVDVKVGISGAVTKVGMPDSYAGTEIATCLSNAIKRWHFPALDSEYGTSFPLLLQAQ